MFDDAAAAGWPDRFQPDPIPVHPDRGFAPAASDAGALLAAVGLSSRAIREVLGHPAGAGADG